jgi:hypothetical protein
MDRAAEFESMIRVTAVTLSAPADILASMSFLKLSGQHS